MRFFLALCFSLFSLNAFAATVTVSMSQNGDAPSIALEMTRIIEGQIMDDYFNSGEIVSSMAILEGGAPSSKETAALIRDAAAGMCDYLVSVYLEYDPIEKIATRSEVSASLKKAEWQVIDVASSKVAGSGSLSIREGASRTGNPRELAKATATTISRECLKIQHEAEEGKR